MKTILLLLLFITLGFAEDAPVPAPVPAGAAPAHAVAAEPAPAPAEKHAETAESAKPVPPPADAHAESAGANLDLEFVDNCKQLGFVNNDGGEARCGGRRKAVCGAARPCRGAALQSRVRLSDGSVLKGTLRRRFLPADTDALGRLRIDLCAVESITADAPQDGAPARYRIAFKNGDRLTVRFPADLKPLRFDTVLGPVPLPLSAVSKLVLEPPNHLTTQPPNLLYHCTFDDAASIEHPAKGPNGKALGGEFVPGKNGKALRVEADKPAFESMLPKGFLGPEGCLEFWAKIEGDDPRYVDGGDPLFVSLYNERGAITLLQFAANNGFARGGLGGAFVSWPFGTIPHYAGSMEYRKVLGDNWADWHHYAMSWKAGGFGDGSFVKVFVDGRPQPVLGGVDDDKVPARLADYANHAHDFGIPWSTARSADHRRSKKPFLVDDLKIWSVAKTEFADPGACPKTPCAKPRILYHCTFDDAAAIERPAAGPSGKVLGGEFVPGKTGKALRIPGNVPTAFVDLPRGFMQPKGTIEFWSKIEDPPDSYGDRGNPRFFGLSLFDDPANPGSCSTYLQFTSNDGMGMSGLCGMIFHRAMATDPQMSTHTYGPLLADPAAWHHYAIVWDSDGLPFSKASDGTPAVATIILDGRVLQTFGRNQFDKGKGLLRLPELQGKLAFPVSDTNWGFFPRPIAFLIDEFKIWSVVKTDFIISSTESPNRRTAEPPKLLYHCTFDDVQSIEHPAAGPSGTFLGGEFVPGKIGNALRSPGDIPVAEVDLPRGMVQPRGTIEFWAKIEEPPASYGDRGNPLFFGLWSFNDPADHGLCSTHLGFCANNGSGMAGLCGMVLHRTATTDPHMRTNTYGPILADPSGWHHYAIVWDKDGLPFSKAADGTPAIVGLALNGRVLQTFGRNELARGEGLLALPRQLGKLAFPLPAARWSAPANHVSFLIDEFKIWSAPVVPIAASHGA